jgi:hypothetical protein
MCTAHASIGESVDCMLRCFVHIIVTKELLLVQEEELERLVGHVHLLSVLCDRQRDLKAVEEQHKAVVEDSEADAELVRQVQTTAVALHEAFMTLRNSLTDQSEDGCPEKLSIASGVKYLVLFARGQHFVPQHWHRHAPEAAAQLAGAGQGRRAPHPGPGRGSWGIIGERAGRRGERGELGEEERASAQRHAVVASTRVQGVPAGHRAELSGDAMAGNKHSAAEHSPSAPSKRRRRG